MTENWTLQMICLFKEWKVLNYSNIFIWFHVYYHNDENSRYGIKINIDCGNGFIGNGPWYFCHASCKLTRSIPFTFVIITYRKFDKMDNMPKLAWEYMPPIRNAAYMRQWISSGSDNGLPPIQRQASI